MELLRTGRQVVHPQVQLQIQPHARRGRRGLPLDIGMHPLQVPQAPHQVAGTNTKTPTCLQGNRFCIVMQWILSRGLPRHASPTRTEIGNVFAAGVDDFVFIHVQMPVRHVQSTIRIKSKTTARYGRGQCKERKSATQKGGTQRYTPQGRRHPRVRHARRLQHLPPPEGPLPVHALPPRQLLEHARLVPPQARVGLRLEQQLEAETLVLVPPESQRARHRLGFISPTENERYSGFGMLDARGGRPSQKIAGAAATQGARKTKITSLAGTHPAHAPHARAPPVPPGTL